MEASIFGFLRGIRRLAPLMRNGVRTLMQRASNLAVDQERASPAAVAEAFLRELREERLGR